MTNHVYWKANIAFACYLVIGAGIIGASIIVVLILFSLGINIQELTFPSALISLPVNEGIILIITILFAKYKNANLTSLGLKKPSYKMIALSSLGTIFLLVFAGTISILQEIILGPDPEAIFIIEAILPRDLFQLLLLIGISFVLVGFAEELAFRGFIQKGLENSFGKSGGLIIASILFGLLHGLNSLRSIIPVTMVSLFLGYIWQRTNGNTTTLVWMHGLYDAITITIAYFVYI